MFDCKTYVLIKDSNASAKSEKLKERALIEFLIDYDFTNSYRVWNLDKWSVNDYRDVLFDETGYYDEYDKIELVNKTELNADAIQFEIFQIRSAMQIAEILESEDEEWLDIIVRDRAIEEDLVPEVNDLHSSMKVNWEFDSWVTHSSYQYEKTPQFVRDEEFTSEYDRAIQTIVQTV